MESKTLVCRICSKGFSSRGNLNKHLRKVHVPTLETGDVSKVYHRCDQCARKFSALRCLRFHKKKAHQTFIPSPSVKPSKCPLCEYACRSTAINLLLDHFKNVHDINTATKEMFFDSFAAFNEWKTVMENDTKSKFVSKRKSDNLIYYTCHRSGIFSSRGKGLRKLKSQGSNKINGYCPAGLKVLVETDAIKVKYIETHVGHENDIAHLPLSYEDRERIALMISSKVISPQAPIDTILDDVRESLSSQSKQTHMLKKRDIYNIRKCFNLSSTSMCEGSGLAEWVSKMRDSESCVLAYKPRNCAELCLKLRTEDFFLVVMTAGQGEVLQKYGNKCVCVDGALGSSGGLELITVVVLDDAGHGFPCAFLVTNRCDTDVLATFFSLIKDTVGELRPKVFMSSLSNSFYTAWCSVMCKPDYRLFSLWNVDQEWRQNLSKIKTRPKKISTYKKLRTIVEEEKQVSFVLAFNELEQSLLEDPDTATFAEYLYKNFRCNVENWACCFTSACGLDTGALERMHCTLKHICFKGRRYKRLDLTLTAVMDFVQGMLQERAEREEKLKALCIAESHELASKLDLSCVICKDSYWEVCVDNECFTVRREFFDCECQLICSECNACPHRFSCTCQDTLMCCHVHLVCRYQSRVSRRLCIDDSGAISFELSHSDNCPQPLPIIADEDQLESKRNSVNEHLLDLMELSKTADEDQIDCLLSLLQHIKPAIIDARNKKNSQTSTDPVTGFLSNKITIISSFPLSSDSQIN